jgi:hypothetical protein
VLAAAPPGRPPQPVPGAAGWLDDQGAEQGGGRLPGVVTQLVTQRSEKATREDRKWPVTWSGWPDLNRRPLRPEAISADMPWPGEAEPWVPYSHLRRCSEWVVLSQLGLSTLAPELAPVAPLEEGRRLADGRLRDGRR